MKNRNLKYTLAILSGIFISSCSSQPKKSVQPKRPVTTAVKPKPEAPKPVDNPAAVSLTLPPVNREFRGAWVATVANINWPSKGNYSPERQKQEAIQILDMLKDANFNAVIFQARPSADALYKSDLEPWSYFLTGEAGRAPEPFYDPLQFWIDEAHKRGMELHVWLNPYRAQHTTGGPVTAKSMASKMSTETYRLRNGMYWMDPSDQKVQDHVSAVIKDIVARYDLDAIHIDDYFYPYKDYNAGRDFPDDRTWQAYLKGGGTVSRAEWRRGNVNKFIKRIHDEIKAEKPYVKFGISPFGIWKPGYPAGITGSSQYDELFADAKLWLNEGWCDYFSPQLYWKEGGAQSYSALLAWWDQENYKSVHLWPGLNTVGVRSTGSRADEIAGQIESTRRLLKNKAGEIHYSVDGISKDYAMQQALKQAYKDKALVPVSPWIKAEPLQKPTLVVNRNGASLSASWTSTAPDKAFHWVLYTKYGGLWYTEILDRQSSSSAIPAARDGKALEAVAVSAVDRLGNESAYDAKIIK